MAYNVESGAVLEVTLVGKLAGQTVLQMWHYRATMSGPLPGAALITSFDSLWNGDEDAPLGSIAKVTCQAYTYQNIRYQWIYPTRYVSSYKDPELPNGTRAEPVMPPNLAVAITRQGDLANRSNVSTIHLAGIPVAGVNAGQITLAYATDFTELLDNVTAAIDNGGANFKPIIYNRKNPLLSLEVTTALLQNTVRTMHRRTVGLGV